MYPKKYPKGPSPYTFYLFTECKNKGYRGLSSLYISMGIRVLGYTQTSSTSPLCEVKFYNDKNVMIICSCCNSDSQKLAQEHIYWLAK